MISNSAPVGYIKQESPCLPPAQLPTTTTTAESLPTEIVAPVASATVPTSVASSFLVPTSASASTAATTATTTTTTTTATTTPAPNASPAPAPRGLYR